MKDATNKNVADKPRCRWVQALLTTDERSEVMATAGARGLNASGLLRASVRRLSSEGMPGDYSMADELRRAVDVAGTWANDSARALSRAARRYARFARLTPNERDELLSLARDARSAAANAARDLSLVTAMSRRVLVAGVVRVPGGRKRDGTRVATMRARFDPDEVEALQDVARERRQSMSATLRVMLLVEARSGGEGRVVFEAAEERAFAVAWSRWRNNAAQAANAISRLRARCLGTGILDAGGERELAAALDETEADSLAASREVSLAMWSLARSGLSLMED